MPEATNALLELPKVDCTVKGVDMTLKKFAPDHILPFSLKPYLGEIARYFQADTLEHVFNNLEHANTDFAKKQINELKKMVCLKK